MLRLLKAIVGAFGGALAGLVAGTVGVAIALMMLGFALLVSALIIGAVVALLGLHLPDLSGPISADTNAIGTPALVNNPVYLFFRVTGFLGAVYGAFDGFRTAWRNSAPLRLPAFPGTRAIA